LNICTNNEHLIINLATVVGGRKEISQQHKALLVSCNLMKSSIFIFLLLGQLTLIAQTSLPTFASGKNDKTTFQQYLPTKADFVFAYSEESYWWSNAENFRLLTKTGNMWTAWIYFKKWKSSSDVYENKGKKKHKYFKKVAIVDSLAVKELFDSLALVSFWTLNVDSLNATRGSNISDDVNYKFQIENTIGRQILESYAPEYFIEKFPDMGQRVVFLKGKDILKRWWKRHAANNALAIWRGDE
jgi:hypothetical protein